MTPAEERLKVMIVDDHEVVRTGLRTLIDSELDLTVVGEAPNGEAAVSRALVLEPDVIVMDVRMGDDETAGIEACREIRNERAETQVLMFTSFGERESVLAAIMAGAAGFLTKNVSHTRLLDAIRALGRGESILDPAVTREVLAELNALAQAADTEPAAGLSERERQVLRLVAQGYTNKEIARDLSVSPFTARNHVTHIMEKLDVSRRSEAAAEAVRLGLTSDGPDAS